MQLVNEYWYQKFDIGDIMLTDSVNIEPNETRPQLTHKMAKLGGDAQTFWYSGLIWKNPHFKAKIRDIIRF